MEQFFRNPRFKTVTDLKKPQRGNEKLTIHEQQKSAQLHVSHQPRVLVERRADCIERLARERLQFTTPPPSRWDEESKFFFLKPSQGGLARASYDFHGTDGYAIRFTEPE
jgi:hypothetical protein